MNYTKCLLAGVERMVGMAKLVSHWLALNSVKEWKVKSEYVFYDVFSRAERKGSQCEIKPEIFSDRTLRLVQHLGRVLPIFASWRVNWQVNYKIYQPLQLDSYFRDLKCPPASAVTSTETRDWQFSTSYSWNRWPCINDPYFHRDRLVWLVLGVFSAFLPNACWERLQLLCDPE